MLRGREAALTALAMTAFAANSVLTRAALAPGLIDAASFGSIRAGSAAVALCGLLALRGTRPALSRDAVFPAAMLVAYLAFFSFAYLSLSTATGALILFGLVQVTMFGMGFVRGEIVSARGYAGLGLAVCGLVYLLFPGLESPDPLGAGLMALAGIAWGFYSLAGRGISDPLGATATNFLFALPPMLLISAVTFAGANATGSGIVLAIASGALASGCGYAIWYAALPSLSAGQAATVQLSAPVIAAIGGVLFLMEPLTLRLSIASLLILGGILLALRDKAN